MPGDDAQRVNAPAIAAVDHQGIGLPRSALTGMLLAASLASLGSTMIAITRCRRCRRGAVAASAWAAEGVTGVGRLGFSW
jgi:hypothetical protein